MGIWGLAGRDRWLHTAVEREGNVLVITDCYDFCLMRS